VADSSNGLLLKNTASQWITIIGPSAKINGKSFINKTGLIAPFNGNENGFAAYNSNGWKNFTKNNTAHLPICIASAIDPKDQTYWLTSKNTLLHFNPSSASIELTTPSSIIGDFNDIQFGSDGNLWLLQDQQGLLKKNNAAWNVYAPPKNFMTNGLNNMLVSKQGQVWIIAPPYQGLYVYQSNQVYGTEIWKQLTTSKSNGNLPSNNVTSLLEDKEGAIWVGTDNGIGIFNCGDISKEICDANLPFITNTNGFVGLLFQKEKINCMAVDGANRKWIGTNNGTWLLSADGRDIITHFTKNNSPLPNDTLVQILIDPNEGEVFFNTASEMVSYRGNATDGAIAQKELFIYPNPVGPNYNGPIAIRQLVENAIVKITELNGRLVYETRALGGQAIWDGKTYEGKKVATGIYLVFVRDDAGNEKGVGKILITSGQ
jgi:ligand-binding sensor domain-containing protein